MFSSAVCLLVFRTLRELEHISDVHDAATPINAERDNSKKRISGNNIIFDTKSSSISPELRPVLKLNADTTNCADSTVDSTFGKSALSALKTKNQG